MEQVIKKISNRFLEEAKSSPQLLADMAAMEKYMAESYGERIFIELLQNADDAKSNRITFYSKNGHIFFANDGKPFNEQDIESICRSGASSKKRGESIGYRGIGFKSTTFLTNTIIIHSNNVGFTFSKELCAKKLQISDSNKVPTVRIPLHVEDIEYEIAEEVQKLYKEGYRTIFIFMDARLSVLEEELAAVNDGYFLFLNNIQIIQINISTIYRNFKVLRDHQRVCIQEDGYEKKEWYIVADRQNKSVQLGFKIGEQGQVIACDREEGVFHCYLPTSEFTGFPFKINCDFSTDPSRKHLTWDEKTKRGLKNAAEQLFNTTVVILQEGHESLLHIFSLLEKRQSFSKFSNYMYDNFVHLIKNEKWIPLYNGEKISAIEYKRKPRFLEPSEFRWMREHSSLKHLTPIASLQQNSSLDNFLESFANGMYEIPDWITILSEREFVVKLDQTLLGKLYGQLMKSVRSKMVLNKEVFQLETCYIKNDQSELMLWGSKGIEYAKSFISEFLNSLTDNDIKWINNTYNTSFTKELSFDNNRLNTSSNADSNIFASSLTSIFSSKKKAISISKWRAAEYQCIEFEQMQGNQAKDVSKQNLGYDVHSETKTGEKRYIEVKSISNRNAEVSLTNNEYTAAHQYGDAYYLCIIYQQDDQLLLEYIQNPLKHLKLEKRVKQWEWICDDYIGEKFVLDFNN
ncbi:sacsin N-terminal ATP-binding-like domain-containing protein [Ammoniphilus sp. CFH 90114]|uniref:sacsin N-terminal ATP-binding-like domain-containing protein n=1 Tax=Ammoniphilus sp. CFH 90114 TaxID=2493665 RepID=UPI00100E9EED|nr:DUF3883 domain-containing protein [Ammoniphilus sp. CFH 90114]RXT14876.1 DUF3883 domain-containing protein [Ammoniphilus sp. CFH 90114]